MFLGLTFRFRIRGWVLAGFQGLGFGDSGLHSMGLEF